MEDGDIHRHSIYIFYFILCMWTWPQRKQISIDSCVIMGGREEDRWCEFGCMSGCVHLSGDSLDGGGDPCGPASCWDSLLRAGR